MGWKAWMIIVDKPADINDGQVLKTLNLNVTNKIIDTSFDKTTETFFNKVAIGRYNGKLIVSIPGLPKKIIEHNDTETEKALINLFPDSEICATELVSTVNYWGYKIIDKGKVIRHRAGDSDKGTYIDFGEPLDEEIPLLSKSSFDDDGKRIYRFDDQPDEIFEESQVGENFVFAICERYLGNPLDEADEFLYNTIFKAYTKTTWWKFWQ